MYNHKNMAKMRYRNLIFVVVIIASLAVVSGCGRDVIVEDQVDSGEQVGDVADEVEKTGYEIIESEKKIVKMKWI